MSSSITSTYRNIDKANHLPCSMATQQRLARDKGEEEQHHTRDRSWERNIEPVEYRIDTEAYGEGYREAQGHVEPFANEFTLVVLGSLRHH